LKRKREFDLLTPSPSTPKKFKKASIVKIEESAINLSTFVSSNPSPTTSSSGSRRESPFSSGAEGTTATDATSVDEDTIVVEPRYFKPSFSSKSRKGRATKFPAPLEQAKSGDTILVSESTSAQHPAVQDDTISILSDLQSDMELDDSSMTIKSKKPNTAGLKRRRKIERPTTDLDHAPEVRVPGDYVLTPALLAEPASAWINCKICEEPFVQKDAYFTRSSCPRCERHSKLYGYMWPKTDKEGKNDTEERVLDHRTVHRFIRPSEERTIRKRDRGSTGSRAVTREASELVIEKDEQDVKKGRGGKQRTKRDRFTL